jgi:hypothetical protein
MSTLTYEKEITALLVIDRITISFPGATRYEIAAIGFFTTEKEIHHV